METFGGACLRYDPRGGSQNPQIWKKSLRVEDQLRRRIAVIDLSLLKAARPKRFAAPGSSRMCKLLPAILIKNSRALTLT